MTVVETRPGEFDLIRRYFAPLASGSPGALGLKDDAALFTPPPGRQLVLTTDTIVAGVHYPDGETPGDVARRLLRVNLSDLAAMGARPEGYLLNVALPRETEEPWIAAFADGLREDQELYGIALLGGDTVGAPVVALFTLTAIGSVPQGAALKRGGAGLGDGIFVSGTIGDGVFGLWAVQDRLPKGFGDPALREALAAGFRRPDPRLELGQALVDRAVATAAADVSDGLLADLGHICAASGLGATICCSDVPLSTAAAVLVESHPHLRREAMTGGDDYELVFTVPMSKLAEIEDLSRSLDLPLTRIGKMEAREGIRVVDRLGDEMPIERYGFQHR